MLDGKGTEEITLPDVYSYTPVGGVIPLPKVRMHNTVKVHAWTGADSRRFAHNGDQAERMVYVTVSGTVYHRNPGCRYLNVVVQQMSGAGVKSARNMYGEKYYACESCSRNQKPAGTVYVTKSGNRYHNQSSCSGLKRTVRLVKLSDVHNMGACSSCG